MEFIKILMSVAVFGVCFLAFGSFSEEYKKKIPEWLMFVLFFVFIFDNINHARIRI